MPRKIKPTPSSGSTWALSVVEHWCKYSRKTGFQPTGLHRQLLDSLFYPHWYICEVCSGPGVINGAEETDWKECPACDGKGGFFTGTTDEWKEIIFRMMSVYPESVCGNTKDRYLNIYHKYAEH